MTKNKLVTTLIVVGITAVISLVWLSGCLSTTEEDFTGQFGPPGRLELHSIPGGDGPDDGDNGDVGDACHELKECVCDQLEGEYYDSCVEAIQSMTEDQCEELLDDYECDGYYYGDDDDDYYYDDDDDYYYDTDYDTD